MLKVGLTGGIGSGKTTVAGLFELLHVPVYYADRRAQALMETDTHIRKAIESLLGQDTITPEGVPDRALIAQKVFKNSDLLKGLNAIVHPAVRKDFDQWCNQYSDKNYVIQEAAILFESGAAALMDENILVWAAEDVRVTRTVKRDDTNEEAVRGRMQHQWSDDQKASRVQFTIINDGAHSLIRQVLDIHHMLLHIAEVSESKTASP